MSEDQKISLWKFTVLDHDWVQDPVDPGLQYKGICVTWRAATLEDAKAGVERYAQETGRNSTFLRVAKVAQLDPQIAGLVCWVEV